MQDVAALQQQATVILYSAGGWLAVSITSGRPHASVTRLVKLRNRPPLKCVPAELSRHRNRTVGDRGVPVESAYECRFAESESEVWDSRLLLPVHSHLSSWEGGSEPGGFVACSRWLSASDTTGKEIVSFESAPRQGCQHVLIVVVIVIVIVVVEYIVIRVDANVVAGT